MVQRRDMPTLDSLLRVVCKALNAYEPPFGEFFLEYLLGLVEKMPIQDEAQARHEDAPGKYELDLQALLQLPDHRSLSPLATKLSRQ